MLSSSSCLSWRFPTSREELNPQSSDASRWDSQQRTDTFKPVFFFFIPASAFIWFSAQDKLSFTPGRKSVFLSNSVNFLCIAGLFVKHIWWTLWSTVLGQVWILQHLPRENNKQGAPYCSSTTCPVSTCVFKSLNSASKNIWFRNDQTGWKHHWYF